MAADEERAETRDMDRALGDAGMPLLEQLGVSFDRYGSGWVEAAWTPTPLASNPFGAVHGGVYGVVHDAAMSFATNSALQRGDRAATLDVQFQLIRAISAGDSVRVRAEVTRVATQVAYVESQMVSPDGEVVSKATATFLLRRRTAK